MVVPSVQTPHLEVKNPWEPGADFMASLQTCQDLKSTRTRGASMTQALAPQRRPHCRAAKPRKQKGFADIGYIIMATCGEIISGWWFEPL